MKLTNKQLKHKLRLLFMLSIIGEPITFPAFKDRCTVRRYSKKEVAVFFGIPNKSIFGFYVTNNTDIAVMRDAYAMYLRLVGEDMTDYEEGNLQWGLRIPTEDSDLEQK